MKDKQKELKINMEKLGKDWGYKIKVIHLKRFSFKVILAGFFIKLGSKILPCKSKVEITHINDWKN